MRESDVDAVVEALADWASLGGPLAEPVLATLYVRSGYASADAGYDPAALATNARLSRIERLIASCGPAPAPALGRAA